MMLWILMNLSLTQNTESDWRNSTTKVPFIWIANENIPKNQRIRFRENDEIFLFHFICVWIFDDHFESTTLQWNFAASRHSFWIHLNLYTFITHTTKIVSRMLNWIHPFVIGEILCRSAKGSSYSKATLNFNNFILSFLFSFCFCFFHCRSFIWFWCNVWWIVDWIIVCIGLTFLPLWLATGCELVRGSVCGA